MGKAVRGKTHYYKVTKTMKVRGSTTNSLDVAKRKQKEMGSDHNIYETDSKGYWVRHY